MRSVRLQSIILEPPRTSRRAPASFAAAGMALCITSLLAHPVLAASPSDATARLQACYGRALSQGDINTCSETAAHAAQTRLNSLYQAVLAKYHDAPAQQARLRSAQQAWERYRDAELHAVYPHAGDPAYATAYTPTCHARLRLSLLRERIARLRQWLDGGIEGDLCAGALNSGALNSGALDSGSLPPSPPPNPSSPPPSLHPSQ